MKKTTYFLLLLSISMVFAACSGSKSYYKKGQKLEKSGLNVEAANFYIEALKRKKTNDDAIISLKVLGQKVLDEKYGTFYKYYSDERTKDAVYAYLEAEDFKSKVSAVGVQLSSSPYYRDYYEEVRDAYVAELYEKAQSQLDNEDFSEAEKKLNEIKRLDPSYKNVSALSDFAFLEPKYRLALKAYDTKEYRKAYHLFNEINKRAISGYKESKDYMQLSLESAQYTIGMLPIENKSRVPNFESAISSSILKAISALNDPFLRLVDRTNTAILVEEQYVNMTGTSNQNGSIETGTILGTKALFVGKVLNVQKNAGSLRKFSRTGWLGKEVRYVDPVSGEKKTRTVYTKVYYYEYEQENNVSCSFQYQLISTATGEVLLSDVLELRESDQVKYATFNGDTKLLVSGYWKNQFKDDPSDRRFDSYQQKRELDALLSARSGLQSVEQQSALIVNRVGQNVAKAIGGYNPETK